MKLVQFEDGTYGVRMYWLFGWHFKDLRNPRFEWTRGGEFFHCCKGTRREAENAIMHHRIAYRVIE